MFTSSKIENNYDDDDIFISDSSNESDDSASTYSTTTSSSTDEDIDNYYFRNKKKLKTKSTTSSSTPTHFVKNKDGDKEKGIKINFDVKDQSILFKNFNPPIKNNSSSSNNNNNNNYFKNIKSLNKNKLNYKKKLSHDVINLTGCCIVNKNGVPLLNKYGRHLLSGDKVECDKKLVFTTNKLTKDSDIIKNRRIAYFIVNSCKDERNLYYNEVISIIQTYLNNKECQDKYLVSNQCNSINFLECIIKKCIFIINKCKHILNNISKRKITIEALKIFNLKISKNQKKFKRIRIPNKQLNWCIDAAMLKLNEVSKSVNDLNFDTKFCQFINSLDDPTLSAALPNINDATYLIKGYIRELKIKENEYFFRALNLYRFIVECDALKQKTPKNLILGVLSYLDINVKEKASRLSNNATINDICLHIDNYLYVMNSHNNFFIGRSNSFQFSNFIEKIYNYARFANGVRIALKEIESVKNCYVDFKQIEHELLLIQNNPNMKKRAIASYPELQKLFKTSEGITDPIILHLLSPCNVFGNSSISEGYIL